jgi:Zn-finger nucleic acid-binding protein
MSIYNKEMSIYNSQKSINSSQMSIKSSEMSIKNSEMSIVKSSKNVQACPKCGKSFQTSQGLRRHQEKCSGVSNPLECPFCHKVLGSRQAKSLHIKNCKIKKAQTVVNQYNETNHIINNTQNNQIIYIIQNNTSKSYNNDEDNWNTEGLNDFGREDFSYIEDPKMKKIALECNYRNLIKEIHFNPLHPENHNVHMNGTESYKVFKNNVWQVEPKNTVHSIVYQHAK